MIPRKCRYQFNVEELVFSNHLDVVWGDVGLHCSLWSMHVAHLYKRGHDVGRLMKIDDM